MTITLTREEAQQVLDALRGDSIHAAKQAIETLRARLSAPEPEPVAGYRWEKGRTPPSVTFTTTAQREWQGLTDEEVSEIERTSMTRARAICAIEAKLKEKNT
jgi:hypothetical protein